MKNKTKPKPRHSARLNPEKPTLICFLLDRTGSMQKGKAETIMGFNAYVKEMREKMPASARFTMMQFDSQSKDMLYERSKLSEVEDLTEKTYVPRGSTPLYDAMAKLIHLTREKTINGAQQYKVMFVSMTDGEENASSEWTLARVQELIKEMETVWKWTFAHIGVGMEGWTAGQTIYRGTQSISNVAMASHKGMDKAMKKMAGANLMYARSSISGQGVCTTIWGKKDANLDED